MLSNADKKKKGLDFKKLTSGLTGILMITTGLLVVIPMSMPTVTAYSTPDVGVNWTFDDLVMNSGGAVIGAYPNYQILDPLISISPSDTLRLMGGEDILCPPGGVIEVLGAFDGTFGLGTIFHGNGLPGSWQGFYVENTGNFFVHGITVTDATDAIFVAGSIMTNIDGCNITNCWGNGITYLNVMGGPMISNCDIWGCDTGIVTVDSSTMMMNNKIFNNSEGIYASGWASPWINECDIYSNAFNGITLQSFQGGSISNCFIEDNQAMGIYMENSWADISDNQIYGKNQTAGSGFFGGNAVIVTGFAVSGWTTSISGNTIIGGAGDKNNGLDNKGGNAIWFNNFDGAHATGPQAVVHNNTLIKGGPGGYNDISPGQAGNGGHGIYIDHLSLTDDPANNAHSIIIENNARIEGGPGGEGISPTDSLSGHGGHGIFVEQYHDEGSVLIRGNQEIVGGDGGNNSADDSGGGFWEVGDGGDGIYIDHMLTLTNTDILDNGLVTGGNGGTGSGVGTFDYAGDGGNALRVVCSWNVNIDPTDFIGGNGGDTMGTSILAGDGGHGINIDIGAPVSVNFNIHLDNVTGIGGKGGDDYFPAGPMGGGAGRGGDGLRVRFAGDVTSQDSIYKGGKGGNAHSDGGMGGEGGWGTYIYVDSQYIAERGEIYGGDGGDSLYAGAPGVGTWAGSGNFAFYTSNYDNVILANQTIIKGGIGGDNLFNFVGTVGYGGGGIYSSGAEYLKVLNSTIEVGTPGTALVNPPAPNQMNGTWGVYAFNIDNGADLIGNVVRGAKNNGIHYTQCDGLIYDNNIQYCGYSGSGIGCDQGSNPHILQNNITLVGEADYGITCQSNSNPHIELNEIRNTGRAVRCLSSSSPLIENCTFGDHVWQTFYLDTDSHPVCLNTTSDKTAYINDGLSSLEMQWYMHTLVVDGSFVPQDNAHVWINNTYDMPVLDAFTPANGWINWTIVTEFIQDMSGKVYYTDHNATGAKGMQMGYATPEPVMDASKEVVIVLGAPSYSIELDQGWNLISIPLIPIDSSLGSILTSIAGQWDYIRVYDPLSPEHWKSNSTYKPDQLNDLDSLDETQGFWIHITTASATLTVTGNMPATTFIPLYAGWNLVGYPSFVEMSIGAALAGTGYDRPVESFDISAPYHLKQLSDFDFMKLGEAYWIHVPVDTIWMVESTAGPSMPYPVFGTVYLYDGTSAGGYAPLASSGGATIEVTWWDVYNGWETIMTVTNPAGQYSVDLMNYTDGGIIYVNATFEAPYNNNGYNYTTVDMMMGMSWQNVVCGIPYIIEILEPIAGQEIWPVVEYPVEYQILDRDGSVAMGYFSYQSPTLDGSFINITCGPISPSPTSYVITPNKIFEGTTDPDPGHLYDADGFWAPFPPGPWYFNVSEGGQEYPESSCLTPWGQFFIDPFNVIPGWYLDYQNITVIVQ